MSKIISTDVSNYCRKESGDVRIFDDEWEKLAKALEVPVEEIKEERIGNAVQKNDNLTFNDGSYNQSGNYNNYCNIPNHILDNLNDYIALLKKQNEELEKENQKLK